MPDLFRVLLPTLAVLFHERHELVVENLLTRAKTGSSEIGDPARTLELRLTSLTAG
jgi:hypothetical protein